MPNKKVTCGSTGCGRPCIIPRTIKAGRCWKHPLLVVTPSPAMRPAGPAPVVPVTAEAAPAATYPTIEIPDTQEGWGAVRDELAARLVVMAQTWQVRLACEGGEVWVDITQSAPGVARLEVRGGVSLGRSRYTVYGLPWQVQVQNGDYGCGRSATPKRTERVRLAVGAAWEAQGAHTPLREMYMAYLAASNCASSYAWLVRPGSAERAERVRADGRHKLLVLAVGKLRGKAHDAATALVDSGHMGPVQDMLDAVAAVVANQPGR